jgi:hypothetical protein
VRSRRATAGAAAAVLMTLAAGSAPARAESDAQLWFELDVGHKLSKTWSLAFEQHLRFDADVSRVSQVMPDLAATARLNKWLRAMVGYRLQYTRTGSGDFALRHRPYLGASARTDLGKMRVSARLLFTEQIRGLASDELRHGVRTKLGATWRGLDRVRPGASLEIFHTISDPDGNGGVELDKVRLGLDVETPLGAGDVGVGYRLEGAHKVPLEPVVHALVVGYALEL